MRTSQKMPFMSVVVCSYNGETTLGRTIESLLAQNYPKNKFEVIVVDDGSSDKTSQIARSYPGVQSIRMPKNEGLSAARNTGLKAAKGDIYVAFDDDCIADLDWLRNLAKGYALKNPAGVGGRMFSIQPPHGITKRYIHDTGSGFTPKAANHDHPVPLIKLVFRYLISNLQRLGVHPDNCIEVSELYGANGSFPVHILKAVEGWRPAMTGIEDRDLCVRIKKRFPESRFYAVKDAKMMHDPDISLKNYLLRPYRRGPLNLRFHLENGLRPPFFPFPVLFMVLALAASVVEIRLLPIVLLLVPQLSYCWWPYYFFSRRDISYLVFPYMQLAEEAMVIVGLLRGYARLRRREPVVR